MNKATANPATNYKPLPAELVGVISVLKCFEKHFGAAADKASRVPAPKLKQRNEDLDTISFLVARDFADDYIEVVVEVLDYEPRQQGGCWDERVGPFITLGDAFYLDGRHCELTPLEREAAEESAIKEIEGGASYKEENLDLED